LGPKGTFSYQAAKRLTNNKLVPVDSINQAIKMVELGKGQAVVPLENSLEGAVNLTIDQLINSQEVVISREYNLDLSFSLFRLNSDNKKLKTVYSHPVALAQCSKFLNGLKTIPTNSTVVALKEIISQGKFGQGAIAPSAVYSDLIEAKRDIADSKAVTRFVLLSKYSLGRTGDDKSAFVFAPKRNRPGILFELLKKFAARGINLFTIKSRPTKNILGEYIFYIEAQGHLKDDSLMNLLKMINQNDFSVKFLGSFPRDPLVKDENFNYQNETVEKMLKKIK
jgi:prephenate dehydratase